MISNLGALASWTKKVFDVERCVIAGDLEVFALEDFIDSSELMKLIKLLNIADFEISEPLVPGFKRSILSTVYGCSDISEEMLGRPLKDELDQCIGLTHLQYSEAQDALLTIRDMNDVCGSRDLFSRIIRAVDYAFLFQDFHWVDAPAVAELTEFPSSCLDHIQVRIDASDCCWRKYCVGYVLLDAVEGWESNIPDGLRDRVKDMLHNTLCESKRVSQYAK